MSSQKISQFTPITVLASGDYFPVVEVSGQTNKRVGVDVLDVRFTAAASGVAAQDTANNALASGNLAFSSGIAAQTTANTALASGNAALQVLIPQTILDAKGDLITATADNTPARLPVGSGGYYLTANSSTSTGLDWTPPPPASYVLLGSGTANNSYEVVPYSTSNIPSGYASYMIVGDYYATNNKVIGIQVAPVNGSFATSSYAYTLAYANAGATSWSFQGSTSQSYIQTNHSFAMSSTYPGTVCIELSNLFHSSRFCQIHWRSQYSNSSATMFTGVGGGTYTGNYNIGRVKLIDYTNFTGFYGTFYLYGRKGAE